LGSAVTNKYCICQQSEIRFKGEFLQLLKNILSSNLLSMTLRLKYMKLQY